ncbi:hypothetical protein [Trinickia dinghuensis]|uniref:Uncharacterized protein n=1 Tax=Trinickia dinghuensis TaxID=2291023 RepID=A0A3D8JY35_9BURK|nr:hypothetical protein [Trinickia dinghuensis]RDU97556.1 hypothetical protein DWV00_16865 [Trinickia dinghuensis]
MADGASIVGDKTNNYVVFDKPNQVVYTFDLKQFGLPRAVPPKVSAPGLPSAPVSGITGNAANGIVYFFGNSVSYLTDVNNPKAKWKALPEAPFKTGIKGMCGDLINGIVIHDGTNIAQIKDVFNNPVWLETNISPRISIAGIAGDGTNGIAVYRNAQSSGKAPTSDDDGKFIPTVYLFSGQLCGTPTPPPEPKIGIEALFGDGLNGYIAMGENQLFSLVKNVWVKLASLNFSFNSATGNPKDGVVALLGSENYVVTTPDCKVLTLAQVLPELKPRSGVQAAAAPTSQPVSSAEAPAETMTA